MPTTDQSTTPTPPALVWFREDLRVSDNPALTAAAEAGGPIVCLFVLETDAALRPHGGASRWWLAQSLRALEAEIAALGARLIILKGPSAELVPRVSDALEARAVFWNRRYGGAERDLDTRIKASLRGAGVKADSFGARLLNEPWEVTTRTGDPMKVFTPYWRAARARGEPGRPLPAPAALRGLAGAAARLTAAGLDPCAVDELALEPTRPDWAGGLRAAWRPGEAGARERLSTFLERGFANYAQARNRPDLPSTSRLSPHLRFGEISIRQCWHAAMQAFHAHASGASEQDLDVFLSELGWREFSHHLLHHNPALATENHNPRFDAFPWRDDPDALKAWEKGRTGYPIVDAGMRELWATGWMHNRVRMIVGSLLVKHLLLDWRAGEAWFWDTLVDADPANNAASWQWVAGSGADAAPYFRIFNPVLQGEKFDPDGAYVRRWVPELARLPKSLIHKPWTAPREILTAAGVRLGATYPHPIVPHEVGRDRALAAFQATKRSAADPDAPDDLADENPGPTRKKTGAGRTAA
jgi:deoxyribodipyrimidine photo-lyase